jgi:hypothetical protein
VGWHRVVDGEWMGSIAAAAGHTGWRHIWAHANNASLRSRRVPELLVEGDRVFVPDVLAKHETAATDARSRFEVARAPDVLKIRFLEVKHYIALFGPISYELIVGPNESTGTITEEAQEINVPLALNVRTGTLTVAGTPYALKIGGLHPVERLSGMQARINNLGWDAGPVDNVSGPRTKRGTRDFQAFYQIQVDGVIGPETRSKAKAVYGS